MTAKSLISENQKTSIKAIIDDIHETFARNIKVYEDGRRVLISASTEYNGIYGRTGGGTSSTSTTVVEHTIKARIKYIDAREQNLADGGIDSQMGIELMDGEVRITVDIAGYNILKDAKRCEFEGRRYLINSRGNPTEFLARNIIIFTLKPTDEGDDIAE